MTCDFSNLTSSGGISRAKKYQLGIKDDAVACLKIPTKVKAILHVDMVEKERIKRGVGAVRYG